MKAWGNATSAASGERRSALRYLATTLLLGTVLSSACPVLAQVVPGGAEAPRMDAAPNGTKIVTINQPSGGGVSSNTYTDFNVGAGGLILNNSAKITSTALAGYIDGNANLKQSGPARVILDQVVSANPSTLAGYLEVAGSAAQVIVANSNGITCNGCGFINTPFATLTTGAVRRGADGSVAGYDVTRGSVVVGGQGLDASGARLDIFARAVTLNAGLYADRATVAAGAGSVTPGADNGNDAGEVVVTALKADAAEAAPRFALDVAALGGMYARSIRLIGTEAGLGVRVDGTLASLERGFTLDASGAVQLSGRIVAATDAAVRASGETSVSGTLYGGGAVALSSGGAITNGGLIGAGGGVALDGASLASNGTLAAGLGRDGTLGTAGDLAITTSGGMSLAGQVVAPGVLSLKGGAIGVASGAQVSGGALTLSTTGLLTNAGSMQAAGATAITAGGIQNAGGTIANLSAAATRVTTGTLDSRGGTIGGNGDVALTASSLDLAAAGSRLIAGGVLTAGVDGATTTTGGGLIQGRGLALTLGSLANASGSVLAGDAAASTIAAGSIDNGAGGVIHGDGQALTLTAGMLTNAGSIEHAGSGALSVTASTAIGNGGRLATNGTLAVAAPTLDNARGTISAGGAVSLATTGTFGNIGGTVTAAGPLDVRAGSIANAGGSILATGSGALTLAAGGALSSIGGTIAGNGDVAVTAGSIDASGIGALTKPGQAGGNGQISAGGALTVNATRGNLVANSGGLLAAGKALSLSATGTIHAEAGTLSAGGAAALKGAAVVLDDGTLAAYTFTIDAGSVSLRRTQLVQTGTADLAIRTPGTLDYSGAIFTSNAGNFTLQAARIVDAGGQIRHAGTGVFALAASVIDNTGGVIATAGTLNLTAGTLDNSGGALSAARDATLAVGGSLANAGGVVVAGGALSLTAGALGNAGGNVEAAGALTARLGSLAGAGGQIKATGTDALAVSVSGAAVAQGGLIGGNGTVSLTAATADLSGTTLTGLTVAVAATGGDLIARGATIQAGSGTGAAFRAGALALSATGAIDAAGGAINGDTVTLKAARLDTSNGQLTANALVTTLGAITNRGGTIAVTGTAPLTIALPGALDNDGGRLVTNAAVLTVSAGSLANDGGTLTTPGTATMTVVGPLANGAGTIAGDAGLSLSAGTLTNAGSIGSSAGAATVAAGSLDNVGSGAIYAGRGLTVNATALTNAGSIAAAGDVSLTADTIDNGATSGVIGAGGRLQLGFGDATLGRLVAGGTLAIAARRDWTVATGQAIVGAHDVTVSVAGTLTNAGSIGANGTLSIGASALDNRAGGTLAGDVLTLAVPGAVTNAGLFNAGRSGALSVGSLANRGQIFGDALTVTATGAIDNSGTAAAIATRAGRLALFTPGGVTNSDGALIHSAGSLVIAGHDDTGSGFGRVATLTNGSATIEAAGAGLLAADTLTNTRTTFTAERVVASSTYVSLPPIYSDSDHRTSERYTDTFSNAAVTTDSGEGRILFGGDLSVDAGALSNRWSTLSAADNLTINAGSLENVALAATEFENQSGILYKEHYVCTDRFIVCFAHGWRDDGTDPLNRDYRTEHGTLTPSIIAAGGALRIVAGMLDNLLLDVDGNVVDAAGALGGTTVAAGTGGALAFAAGSAGDGVSTLGSTGAVTTGGTLVGDALTGRAALVVPTLGGNGALTSVAGQPVTLGLVALTGVPSRSASAFQIGLGGLFSFAANPARGYLIETNSAFTNGGAFLSSDYFLNRVGYDPARVEERLGDGYYEQELVGRQLAALTGTTRLAGFADNESQYRALLDAGATYAKAFDLAPGIGLSAAQMASLTSDLVLLVDVQVQTPTGPQHALAPMVYLSSAHAGGVGNAGALLSSGGALSVQSTGDLVNTGTIRGGTAAGVAAGGSLTNGGVVSSAGPLAVTAGGDLVSRAGRFAGSDVAIAAGGNIDLGATSSTARSVTVNGLAATTTETMTNNLTSIQAGNSLSVVAGRNLTSQGAQLSAGDTATVLAGGSATLGAVNDQTRTVDWAPIKHGATSTTSVDQTAIGTGITGTNGVTVAAGLADPTGRLSISGGNITSNGAIALSGAGGVDIGAATEHDSAATASYTRKSGFLSTTRTSATDTITRDVAAGSTVSGGSVDVTSGGALAITGSNVVADRDVALSAAGPLSIGAAQTIQHEETTSSYKKSGLSIGGGGLFLGVAKTSSKATSDGVSNIGSVVGSTGGNVTAISDGALAVTGSTVAAPGTVTLAGRSVSIANATDTLDTTSSMKSSSFGLSIGGSSPLTDGARTIERMGSIAGSTDNARVAAVSGLAGALAVKNTADAVSRGLLGGATLSIGLGFSSSRSSAATHDETAVASQVNGGNVNLVARGAGAGSTIGVVGSDVAATGDPAAGLGNLTLAADGPITLAAAQQNATRTGSSSSSGASIGVSIGVGANEGSGFGVPSLNLGFNSAHGNYAGATTTNREATLAATGTAQVTTPGVLTLDGATLAANRVEVNAGSLAIASRQDTSTYTERNKSLGLTLSVTPAGAVSGAANLGSGKGDGAFRSVAEQAGIYAGAGGYGIDVAGATSLTGAVIASTADPSLNVLRTGTLSVGDLQNSETYRSSQSNMGIGLGNIGQNRNVQPTTNGSGAPLSGVSTPLGTLSATPPVALSASGSQSSVTRSAIAPGTIAITSGDAASLAAAATVSRDSATANAALTQQYTDAKRAEISQGFEAATQLTGQVATFLSNQGQKADTWTKAHQDAAPGDNPFATWEAGGTGRLVLTALSGAAGSNVTGSLGGLVQASAVNVLQGLATQRVKELVDTTPVGVFGSTKGREATRGALQALTACAGSVAGGSGACGGAALGAAASVVLNNLLSTGASTGTDAGGRPLSAADQQARANLVATIVDGIATGAGLDANAATTAASIETTNNATTRTRFGTVCVAGTTTGCSGLTVQQMLAGNRKAWAPVLESIARALGSTDSTAIAAIYTQLASDAAATGHAITDTQIATGVAAYKGRQAGGDQLASALNGVPSDVLPGVRADLSSLSQSVSLDDPLTRFGAWATSGLSPDTKADLLVTSLTGLETYRQAGIGVGTGLKKSAVGAADGIYGLGQLAYDSSLAGQLTDPGGAARDAAAIGKGLGNLPGAVATGIDNCLVNNATAACTSGATQGLVAIGGAPASEFALGRITGIASDARGLLADRIAATQEVAARDAALRKAAAEGNSIGARAEAEAGTNLPVGSLQRQIVAGEPFVSPSGIKITPTPGVTTTVLGSFRSDLNTVINDTLAYPKTADFGANPAGYNVLNLPSNGAKGADTFYRTPDQFWAEYNQPFLDAAISRGDAIVLASKPTRDVLVNVDTGELTGFGRELEYLNKKGYHFDPATNRMIRSGK